MNKANMILVIAVLAFGLIGCQAAKQAVQDYQTGVATPLADGEIAPKEAAQAIAGPIAAVPIIGQLAPTAVVLLTILGTWMRGKKIRKGQPPSSNPITGNWGAKVGAESVIQNLANIFSGVFQVGESGSGFKRVWKVGLATALGLTGTAVMIPQVKELLIANPDIGLTITGITALFAGLEKEIQKVLPVTPKPEA